MVLTKKKKNTFGGYNKLFENCEIVEMLFSYEPYKKHGIAPKIFQFKLHKTMASVKLR